MTGAEIEPPKESINTVMHTLAIRPWPPGLGFKIRMLSDLFGRRQVSLEPTYRSHMCIYRKVISWVIPVSRKTSYIQNIILLSPPRSYHIFTIFMTPSLRHKISVKRKQTHLNSVSHSKYVALNTSEPDTRGLLRHLPVYIAWSWSIDGTRYHPNSLDWNCQWICRTAFLLTSAGQH